MCDARQLTYASTASFANVMVAQQNLSQLVDSYQHWWALAGVDMAFDPAPRNLLVLPKPEILANSVPDVSAPDVVIAKGAAAASRTPSVRSPLSPDQSDYGLTDPIPLPANLDDFQDWLRTNALLPGSFWSTQRAAPHGAINPRIMVIGDQPDPIDLEQGKIFSGPAGALLDAMLAAIQVPADRVYKASFSITRNVKGTMKASEKDALVRIARHHMALVNPDYVLILGRNTGLALMNQDVTIPAQSLREINHLSGNVAAIGTFHPRAMLDQPALKKQAWETLKILAAHMKTTG
jgi:uracil-DNA glycosylase